MSLCELLDLGYSFLADSAESRDQLDEDIGLNERDRSEADVMSLISEMGGEIASG